MKCRWNTVRRCMASSDDQWEACGANATHVRFWIKSELSDAASGGGLCERHAQDWQGSYSKYKAGRVEPLQIYRVGDDGWIALECALFTLAGAR